MYIFIQTNILAETCQTHMNQAKEVRGQENTDLHGYDTLHNYAVYNRSKNPLLLHAFST